MRIFPLRIGHVGLLRDSSLWGAFIPITAMTCSFGRPMFAARPMPNGGWSTRFPPRAKVLHPRMLSLRHSDLNPGTAQSGARQVMSVKAQDQRLLPPGESKFARQGVI